MNYTNNANLPQSIVNAVTNDTYSKGKADYSASQLGNPPQQQRLFSLNASKITVDVADEIWKLLGTGVHAALEDAEYKKTDVSKVKSIVDTLLAPMFALYSNSNVHYGKLTEGSSRSAILKDLMDDITAYKNKMAQEAEQILSSLQKTTADIENRMFATLAGKIISGQQDRLDPMLKLIEDYKVTSVWKVLKGDYQDWTEQLNIYRWLAYHQPKPIVIDKLQVTAILKDWKKHEIGRNPNYPKVPVAVIEIEVWDMVRITRHILDKVEVHEKAKLITDPKELADKFPCSDKDRWVKPGSWKVIKEGNQKASKVFYEDNYENKNQARADATAYQADKGNEYKVIFSGGEPTRCLEYCNVAQFCKQFNQTAVITDNTDTQEFLESLPNGKVIEEIKIISMDKQTDPIETKQPLTPVSGAENDSIVESNIIVNPIEKKPVEELRNDSPKKFDVNALLAGIKKNPKPELEPLKENMLAKAADEHKKMYDDKVAADKALEDIKTEDPKVDTTALNDFDEFFSNAKSVDVTKDDSEIGDLLEGMGI